MKFSGLKNLVFIAVLSRICIFLVMIVGFYFSPFNIIVHDANFVYPPNEAITLSTSFKTWDGQHYIFLAEKGYAPNQISNAFYPLYPALMQAFRGLFLNNMLLAGLILSNMFFFIAIIYFYLLVKKLFDEKTAFISGLFLLAFPTSFYTGLVYTESLFLMLSVLFFYFLYQKNLPGAFIAAFLLPLSRPQGILLLFPLIVHLAFQSFDKGKFKSRMINEYSLILGMLAGFCAYLVFMNYFTGSYWTGFEVQRKYFIAHGSILNIFDPAKWFINNFVNISLTLHGYKTSVIDRLFFIGFLVLLFPAYKKLDKTLFCCILFLGLIPALTGSMMSYTRHVFEAFPMFIVMALLFKEKHCYATIPMIVLQTIFVLRQALNYWVS